MSQKAGALREADENPGPRNDSPSRIPRRDMRWLAAEHACEPELRRIAFEWNRKKNTLTTRDRATFAALSLVLALHELGFSRDDHKRDRLSEAVEVFTKLTPAAVTVERYCQSFRYPFEDLTLNEALQLRNTVVDNLRTHGLPAEVIVNARRISVEPGSRPDRVSLSRFLRSLTDALTPLAETAATRRRTTTG
jgi:hypothetical protein